MLFFPTCKVRVARFYQNYSAFFSFFSSSPSSPILFAKCLVSPILFMNPLRQVSRQSASPSVSPILFASSGSQCTAGPHPPGSDRSVHRRTASAKVRSQCAPLDLIRQGPIAVCTAGPHPAQPDRRAHRLTSTAKQNAKKYARIIAR